ncbi:MAG: citrate/2-methylcitrate synthase [Phycisphaerales bacterium]
MAATGTTAAGADKQAALARGLEGVIGGQTAVCSIEQDKLIYRGYEIHDLAANATFEEVAFLLLVGHKATADELKKFSAEIVADRQLPAAVTAFIESSAGWLASGRAVPMDVLRTAVSILGHTDPDCQDNSAAANLRKSKRLLAKIPTIVGHMQNAIDGRPVIAPDASLGHAANLLYMMTGRKPSTDEARVMDVSLILYAEHEFNASTFTCRVIAGTLSDMHGAVCGGIGALKGPLHGGANEMAMEMLKEIYKDVGEAGIGTPKVDEWMQKAFDTKRKLMGFGHRVYKNGDHRAGILHGLGKKMAASIDSSGQPTFGGLRAPKWFELGEQVQKIMLTKKNIHPNVDFPCGMTYFTMKIPVPQYTPIFVCARITGWCAHVMEQHADNRLIRPLSIYTGPAEKPWKG